MYIYIFKHQLQITTSQSGFFYSFELNDNSHQLHSALAHVAIFDSKCIHIAADGIIRLLVITHTPAEKHRDGLLDIRTSQRGPIRTFGNLCWNGKGHKHIGLINDIHISL